MLTDHIMGSEPVVINERCESFEEHKQIFTEVAHERDWAGYVLIMKQPVTDLKDKGMTIIALC